MELHRGERDEERERAREGGRNKGGKEGGVLAPAYTGPDVLRLKN